MPLKTIKDVTDPEGKRKVVVLVKDKKPYVIGSRVPLPISVCTEVDYHMHQVQQALMPVQLKVRPITSKGA